MDPAELIIKPKLRAPTPRPEQVIRPRLLELLGTAVDYKITLVSAPAGYGKTTLLSQWGYGAGVSFAFAWVSLDEQDNDPARLWRHIVEAVRLAAPEEGVRADVRLGIGVAGRTLFETSLPMLINELAGLDRRWIMVFDDYQFITNNECHESMAFFLDHLPENVHLVFASRSDPPLPLGRLRARGEMNEIRDEQLAFSEEEAAYLLNKTMGLGIGFDDLRLLLERTEGWPAAIYLASLSLQKREDKRAFIEAFQGSDRYIVDLLAEEVLAGVQADVREFLLRTSILRRLSGPLCDAVVGREGSIKLLRELSRSNLFLVPLDERGEWYRYHQLFSQFLLYELESRSPELVPVLYGRASAWMEGEGFFDAAIRNAVAATNYERAGLLVARHWYGYVLAGQMATVERWLESLPEAQAAHDPALLLVKAWICVLSGRGEEGGRLLTLAEGIPHKGPLPDGTASVETGTAIIRGIFGFGGVQSTLEAARRAVESEPELTSPRAALMRFGLGSSYYLSGERSLARKRLEEAIELTVSGQPLLRMVCLSYLSIIASDEGRLEEAERLAREARALLGRFGLQGVPQSSWVPIALGYLLAKQGDLVEAEAQLESGVSARTRLPRISPWPTLIGLLALARVRSGRGDRGGAQAVLAEVRTILERYPDSGIFPSLLALQERGLRRKSRRRNGELTEREIDVLRLLAGELSTRQIAQSLYVAPSTVRTQVKSVYRKLGVSSRKEAVEEARVRGLI